MTQSRLTFIQGKPPASLLPWLLATGSLTARLERHAATKLCVIPMFEGRRRLTKGELGKLAKPPKRPQSAWVREATLAPNADATAWVAAYSVFPLTSLIGEAKQLANLGNTPIGYVMFGRGGAVLVKRWIEETSLGWQRTSLYEWQGRKLLITEVFLTAFLQTLV